MPNSKSRYAGETKDQLREGMINNIHSTKYPHIKWNSCHLILEHIQLLNLKNILHILLLMFKNKASSLFAFQEEFN